MDDTNRTSIRYAGRTSILLSTRTSTYDLIYHIVNTLVIWLCGYGMEQPGKCNYSELVYIVYRSFSSSLFPLFLYLIQCYPVLLMVAITALGLVGFIMFMFAVKMASSLTILCRLTCITACCYCKFTFKDW